MTNSNLTHGIHCLWYWPLIGETDIVNFSRVDMCFVLKIMSNELGVFASDVSFIVMRKKHSKFRNHQDYWVCTTNPELDQPQSQQIESHLQAAQDSKVRYQMCSTQASGTRQVISDEEMEFHVWEDLGEPCNDWSNCGTNSSILKNPVRRLLIRTRKCVVGATGDSMNSMEISMVMHT